MNKRQTTKQVFVTTSWDDGHVLDMKLADMLVQYGIKGTFYVAPLSREITKNERLNEKMIRALSQNFEIGAHTMTHHHLPTLSHLDAKYEIEESKQYLEGVVGKRVTSFCYPAGKYRRVHTAIVRNAGFVCARTTKRFFFDKDEHPFEMKTSVHTYNHWLDIIPLLKFTHYNPFRFFLLYRKWDAQAIAMFDYVHEHGGVFHLWGHSWEVNAQNDWSALERVLNHIAGHGDVQYVTNSALYA